MNRRSLRALAAVDEDLMDSVRNAVLSEAGPLTPSRIATAVQASGRLLGTSGSLAAVERISAELQGFGPLQPLLRDPAVTDIFVNGPQSIWLDAGRGAERCGAAFDSEESLRALAARLVSAGGRRLDDSSPCVDVRLPGGFRVHAVIPPVSTSGTLLSLRIRRSSVFSLQELTVNGFIDATAAPLLRSLIESRLSFLISGAAGSGKTTLLSTLLGLCGRNERIVLIEDAAELNPAHPHVLSLESRHANAEGTGAVDLAELVRQALRMSPTRLIVGECRGAEVRELLAALNTGHAGGGTVHANSSADVPARLHALGALAGLSPQAVTLQTASAVDVVLHLERSGGRRRLAEIALVVLSDGQLTVVPALRRTAAGWSYRPGWTELERLLRTPTDER
ncbi:MAG: TadA family conjugal transfer-associated ATPase [Actinomycetales bacterium]